jgi:hypothetical protein
MAKWICAILLLLSVACLSRGEQTNELTGTWINSTPTNDLKNPNPVIKWGLITFATNNTVVWVWVCNSQTETNSGSYALQIEKPAQPGSREKRNILVTPKSLAVTMPIVLSNVDVDFDCRFHQNFGLILHFTDEGGNSLAFIRKDKKLRTKESTLP